MHSQAGIIPLPEVGGGGDNLACDDLMLAVYDELRRLAEVYLRKERVDHTLQPTALVHEAYLRLIEQATVQWQNRDHFIGMAALMMRRVLVNHAVNRQREKRGGGEIKLSLAEADRFAHGEDVKLIALDEALKKFEKTFPDEAKIVELRFFGGLSIAETARFLNVSDSTVERDWRFARTWLLRELTV